MSAEGIDGEIVYVVRRDTSNKWAQEAAEVRELLAAEDGRMSTPTEVAKPRWFGLTQIDGLWVRIGALRDVWYAAHAESPPYFCIDGESEDAVRAAAARAIRFYRSVNWRAESLEERWDRAWDRTHDRDD